MEGMIAGFRLRDGRSVLEGLLSFDDFAAY